MEVPYFSFLQFDDGGNKERTQEMLLYMAGKIFIFSSDENSKMTKYHYKKLLLKEGIKKPALLVLEIQVREEKSRFKKEEEDRDKINE
jgi:hypothetical protein